MSRFLPKACFSRPFLLLLCVGALFVPAAAAPVPAPSVSTKATPATISGQDVDGHTVTVNAAGHCTVVMYTNPDLEDVSRKITLALDSYRGRHDFKLVRVVDFRGGIPPAMHGIVNGQIRKEQAKEDARLKKAGVAATQAPIIPDFSGSTLAALGWNDIYDQIHLVVYDRKGHEVKRLEDVTDAKQLTEAVDSVL